MNVSNLIGIITREKNLEMKTLMKSPLCELTRNRRHKRDEAYNNNPVNKKDTNKTFDFYQTISD